MPLLCDLFPQKQGAPAPTKPLRFTFASTATFRPPAERPEMLLDVLPKPGETIHCIIPEQARWHYWTVVPRLLQLHGGTIETLYLTTLSVNPDVAAELIQLVQARTIQRCCPMVGDWYAADKAYAATLASLQHALAEYDGWCVAARNHTKLILARFTAGAHFVSEGSANLRACASIEAVCITQSPELWQFHAAWIEAEHARLMEKGT